MEDPAFAGFLSDQLDLIFYACSLRYYHTHHPDLSVSSGSSCLGKFLSDQVDLLHIICIIKSDILLIDIAMTTCIQSNQPGVLDTVSSLRFFGGRDPWICIGHTTSHSDLQMYRLSQPLRSSWGRPCWIRASISCESRNGNILTKLWRWCLREGILSSVKYNHSIQLSYYWLVWSLRLHFDWRMTSKQPNAQTRDYRAWDHILDAWLW